MRYRDCNRARELAEGSIDAILERWDPDEGWDGDYLEKTCGLKIWGTIENTYRDGNILIGLGRSVGPLVKYFRTTGFGPALELALQLKDKMLHDCFWEDGCYDAEQVRTPCAFDYIVNVLAGAIGRSAAGLRITKPCEKVLRQRSLAVFATKLDGRVSTRKEATDPKWGR